MNKNSFTIRVMTRQEVSIAIGWAAQEGWNPGLYDAECFYNADPNGYLIGLLGDEPIACISAVKYDNIFGFLGFYIVKPDFRNLGYGIQIWNAGLAYLKGCIIGLDGVIAQQENYQKSGFKLAYQNVRYQGFANGKSLGDNRIISLTAFSFVKLLHYDQPFFPGHRMEFLHSWIKQPQSTALGLVIDYKLAGYGVIRVCQSGFKIGPLFADSAEFSELLFNELQASVPQGSTIFLDIPIVNAEAIQLVKRHQMVSVFETARMYKGEVPEIPLDNIFGVTSFELG
jgi:Acetyltransferase (GNAT) domain/Acetyltransferase (GNAT) family